MASESDMVDLATQTCQEAIANLNIFGALRSWSNQDCFDCMSYYQNEDELVEDCHPYSEGWYLL